MVQELDCGDEYLEVDMSKYDRMPFQARLIEKLFEVVKKNGRMSAKRINSEVLAELPDTPFSVEEAKRIRYRLNWERKQLEQVGYLARVEGTRDWKLGPGGEIFNRIDGAEVIATRSRMDARNFRKRK